MIFRIVRLFPRDSKRTKPALHQNPNGIAGLIYGIKKAGGFEIGRGQSVGVTGQSPQKRQIKWGTLKSFWLNLRYQTRWEKRFNHIKFKGRKRKKEWREFVTSKNGNDMRKGIEHCTIFSLSRQGESLRAPVLITGIWDDLSATYLVIRDIDELSRYILKPY